MGAVPPPGSLFPFSDAAPTITVLVETPAPPSEPSPDTGDSSDKPGKGSSPGSSPRRSPSPKGRRLSPEAQLSIQQHKEARRLRAAGRLAGA